MSVNNIGKIVIFQFLPAHVGRYSSRLKKAFERTPAASTQIIENIDHFPSDRPKTKRALVSLSPDSWIAAVKAFPEIKLFNVIGLSYELVKALNENGYVVDIVDYTLEHRPVRRYDLFIGHGGKCRTIIDSLPPETRILQYVSGAYWKLFNRESEDRYEAFKARKNVKEQLTFKRSYDGIIEGEEYLTRKADILFTVNCPRMIDSFGEYKGKFYFTGYGSYLDELLAVPHADKDFEAGRKNFIYVGGTGGNIQKGMDVLLEAFHKMPDLHLYIYCKVEDEIFAYYKDELKAPNIHYIYHWRFKPFHGRLKELMKRVNFTVHAPINTGLGTAFMGSMGLGLIPVGYLDLIADAESCVVTDSWAIDSLVECIGEASRKPEAWYKKAAQLIEANARENWSIEGFSRKLNILIRRLAQEQP